MAPRLRSTAIGSTIALSLVLASTLEPAHAAPAAPKGPHPRLFLDATTLAAAKAKVSVAGSAAARAIAKCKDVAVKPADYTDSGYQGDNWAFPLSACAIAYQLTADATYATTAIKLWNAVLNDITTMGDGKACVVGASATQAIAAVKRDTGYAIRFIGPHAALAYDWLHDAPGVDEALRAHTRACFGAWVDWYTSSGYLNDVPGSNYHAGYVAAKALISVAEGGEAGAAGDTAWTQAVDDIFGKQLVGKGLAPGGALDGGDWPEGWQYGPLSVLHLSLAARALEEQGASLPATHGWASDLTLRFLYGLAPARDVGYVGGDTESTGPFIEPSARILLATIIGPGSPEAAGWAASLRTTVAKTNDDAPAFDVLAEARAVTPVDPTTKALPLWYLAHGTRNLYARTSWTPTAFWAVFTSSPRQVPDHQHVDASNFVFSRGADHLVVDPSPYGSRSSLTSNAVTLETRVVAGEYTPSQTPWSKADLPWARGTKSGMVAARSDFAQAFIFSDTPSDVAFARRDWVFLPEGEVVAIDRARTDASTRSVYLRFRTPAKLTLSGADASGAVGGSKIVIHGVATSGATPAVKSYPVVDNCDTGPFGACTSARIAVDEYSLKIAGPRVLAIHAIDGLSSTEAPATVTSMNGAPVDVTPAQNAGVIGAAVFRGSVQTYVVASSANDGVAGATMTYGVPGAGGARHVVFDAPEDASGKSTIAVATSGGRCVITITAGGPTAGRPLMFSVSGATDGCKVSDDPDAPPGSVGPGGDAGPGTDGGPAIDSGPGTDGGSPGSDGGTIGDGGPSDGATPANDSSGCGCTTPGRSDVDPRMTLFAIMALFGVLTRRKNHSTSAQQRMPRPG